METIERISFTVNQEIELSWKKPQIKWHDGKLIAIQEKHTHSWDDEIIMAGLELRGCELNVSFVG